MKQLAKRLSLTFPPVRRLYTELLNARVELDHLRTEVEIEKAKAEFGNISEFIDRWCGKHLITQARANLFAAKAFRSVSEQPSLGTRWDSYSRKLLGDIENIANIVQAITYAQTRIGFETRGHDSACVNFVDMMVAKINRNYPHCAEMISRASESPLSLLTHSSGVIKRGDKLFAVQQIVNVEAFCYMVTKLGIVPRKVLEIGGGYGSSCRDWVNMSRDRLEKYYILDIPESLFYSEIYLKAHFGSSVVGHLADPYITERMDDFQIILCPLSMMDILADLSIELAINVGSMQEMSGDWLEYYDRFLSESQIKNFYSSNYFLPSIQKLNEGMNLFTPRLSTEWKLLDHEFGIDTNAAENRHVMRGIFVKLPSEEDEDALMKDVTLIEDRALGEPIGTKTEEALFRFIFAVRRGAAIPASVSLRVLRAMVTRFPYVPKEALYLARLLFGQAVGLTQAERDEIEQLCRKLERLLPDDRKDVT